MTLTRGSREAKKVCAASSTLGKTKYIAFLNVLTFPLPIQLASSKLDGVQRTYAAMPSESFSDLDLNLQKNPNKSVLLQEMPFGTYQHHSLNTLTRKQSAPHFTLRATSALPTFVQPRNNIGWLEKQICVSYWAEWLFIDDSSAFLQAVDDSVPCQEVKHNGLRGLVESNSFLFKKHT